MTIWMPTLLYTSQLCVRKTKILFDLDNNGMQNIIPLLFVVLNNLEQNDPSLIPPIKYI